MKPEKFNQIKEEIITQLSNIKYHGDLSDIGNEIGIIIGKHFDLDTLKREKYFFHGIEHGISLSDGTHPL